MKSLSAVVVALTLSYSMAPIARAQNQQPSPESRRRVVRKVAPEYPQAAKRIGLGGTVKVVALVATDGSVKKVEPVGGSPILMQAAQTAITQWKYAPGAESQESVELHFTP
jgi:TonB family protein